MLSSIWTAGLPAWDVQEENKGRKRKRKKEIGKVCKAGLKEKLVMERKVHFETL
jgi:hypothetical protein